MQKFHANMDLQRVRCENKWIWQMWQTQMEFNNTYGMSHFNFSNVLLCSWLYTVLANFRQSLEWYDRPCPVVHHAILQGSPSVAGYFLLENHILWIASKSCSTHFWQDLCQRIASHSLILILLYLVVKIRNVRFNSNLP